MPQFELVQNVTFKYVIEAPHEDAAFDTKFGLEPEPEFQENGHRRKIIGSESTFVGSSTPIWDVTIKQDYEDERFDRAEMTIVADDPEDVKDKAWKRFDETFDADYARGEDVEHTSASFYAEERHGDRTIEYTV